MYLQVYFLKYFWTERGAVSIHGWANSSNLNFYKSYSENQLAFSFFKKTFAVVHKVYNIFFSSNPTTGICFLAYFGVSAVLTLMWPYSTLPQEGTLPEVFALRGAAWAKYVIAIGALCGLTSSLLGALVPLPRMLYSMARDGLIFK